MKVCKLLHMYVHMQVGIEQMVARVQLLDQFVKQVVAPLGILFPFPFHCRILDTYMRSSGYIAAIKAKAPGQTGMVSSLQSGPLINRYGEFPLRALIKVW